MYLPAVACAIIGGVGGWLYFDSLVWWAFFALAAVGGGVANWIYVTGMKDEDSGST